MVLTLFSELWNLKEYWDLFYKYRGLQGGFLWQWINHGITKVAKDGTKYFAYGGDFGDHPNDANFICNGFVFPDRSPKPALFEFKKLVQPIKVKAVGQGKNKFKITNTDFFLNADWLKGSWRLELEGCVVQQGDLPALKIAPQESIDIELPLTKQIMKAGEEAFVTLTFTAKEKQNWCPKGHLVAWEQFKMPWTKGQRALPNAKANDVELQESKTLASVMVGDRKIIFDKKAGRLLRISQKDQVLVKRGPEFNIWRSPIDNDAMKAKFDSLADSNKIVKQWIECGYHNLKVSLLGCSVKQVKGDIVVTFKHRYETAKKGKGFKHQHSYKVSSNGAVLCEHQFSFAKGMIDPPKLGIRMTVAGDLENLSWFGPGPHETYCDRNQAEIGIHSGKVAEQFVPYAVPQENGNKDSVRWFRLRGGKQTLQILGDNNFGFSAHHFAPEDLDSAYHTYEVKQRDYITVMIDAAQRGVGSGACGPATLEQYKILPGTYKLSFSIS